MLRASLRAASRAPLLRTAWPLARHAVSTAASADVSEALFGKLPVGAKHVEDAVATMAPADLHDAIVKRVRAPRHAPSRRDRLALRKIALASFTRRTHRRPQSGSSSWRSARRVRRTCRSSSRRTTISSRTGG
jgi:hypothetical protein